MSAKHTPGPWRVSRNGTSVITENVEPSGGFVADCDSLKAHRGERDAANARLIAAAPELLEALQLVVGEFCKDGHGGEFEDGEHPYVDKARAAIAQVCDPAVGHYALKPVYGAAPELLAAAKRLEARGFFVPVGCADDATLADMKRMREAILAAAGGAV